jgi:hypothetical protein
MSEDLTWEISPLLDVSKLSGDEVSVRLRKIVEFRYQ